MPISFFVSGYFPQTMQLKIFFAIKLLDTIRKAMKNWNLSATEVMNGFEISPERQKELLPLI